MKWILATIVAALFALAKGRPGDNLFEIEKQRLVKFPEETFRYEENEQKSSEAKRIIEEINKINVALGYVKKQEPSLPSMLNSDQFLFPKPLYHPFNSQVNGGSLQPSIRNLKIASDSLPNQHKSKEPTKPKLFFYYYVPKSINVPTGKDSNKSSYEVPVKLTTLTRNDYVNQKSPKEYKLIDYKVVGDIDIPSEKDEESNTQSPRLRLYFVPRQLKLSEKPKEYVTNQKLTRIEKVPTIRPFSKSSTEKTTPTTKAAVSSAKKYISSSTTTTALPTPVPSLKTPFASFFNRPGNVLAGQKVESKPVLQSVPLSVPQAPTQQPPKPFVISNEDYTWGMDSSEENDYPQEVEKHIFSAKRKEMSEVQKEALKESGIIIQRLKVRKGGIAIAGPGGVATAGSGGTAIVGPGGYALTHPRSLTIAGPGAKVIAIPQTTDLKDALLRSNSGKSYTDQGEVVATGPVIYYSPDDNSQIL